MGEQVSYWLGFYSAQTKNKEVQPFATEAAALQERDRKKPHWGVPNRITIPFQAATAEEALAKMDRY